MKVNSNKDSVELSQLSRSKKGDKAGAAKAKDGADSLANAMAAGATANVDISSEAKTLSAANQAARAGGVNQEKIDRIKAAINGGTYKPDFGQVAEKMVTENLLQDLS
ncbi:MAG: flagellar biosynthesis anti-sigma factor FlgM [Bdellovibrionota bacterium]